MLRNECSGAVAADGGAVAGEPLDSHQLERFIKGWFVGRFDPTLISTDAIEVAIKHYRAGDNEQEHYHKIAMEMAAVLRGRVRMSGEEFGTGEIAKIKPGRSTDFKALTDVTTVMVRALFVLGDKYMGRA